MLTFLSAGAKGALLAALAALLFGVSTPAASVLLVGLPPVLLSALLYLGSGIGLLVLRVALPPAPAALQARRNRPPAAEMACLLGAIVLGGMLAPVSLLYGLQRCSAASASLLLNLEGVFTVLLAWRLFHERVDRALILGIGCIILAGVLLGWPAGPEAATAASQGPGAIGPALIALACLCWALDNNLTRNVAYFDARSIAMWKGLAAGSANLVLALAFSAQGRAALAAPLPTLLVTALLLGFVSYGLSLVAYLRAQALLGTARTSAWFGLAPFVGALLSLLVLHVAGPPLLWPAAGLMAFGLYLHVRERHTHWHTHAAQTHQHWHRHDAHHQHAHAFEWDGHEPHRHLHDHLPLSHDHVHFPDLHHRHTHSDPAPDDVHTPGR